MSSDLLLLVNSVKTPGNIEPFLSYLRQSNIEGVDVLFSLEIDEHLSDYFDVLDMVSLENIYIRTFTGFNTAKKLNSSVLPVISKYKYIGVVPDSWSPSDSNWSRTVRTELDNLKTGILCGYHPLDNFISYVFLTSDIIKVLGYVVPEFLSDCHFSPFWLDLGIYTERIKLILDKDNQLDSSPLFRYSEYSDVIDDAIARVLSVAR